MNANELARLIEISARLVFDPDSDLRVSFSGASLNEVLSHLAREVSESKLSGDGIVKSWEKGVDNFRQVMVESAIERESTIDTPDGPLTLVRERDALKAARKCAKGPGRARRYEATA